MIKKDRLTLLTSTIFVVFSLWWLFIRFSPTSDLQNQVFAASYGLMALWGGVLGIFTSMKWGGFKSLMGRAVIMFSFGLLAQEFGQLAYSYYIYFAHIEVPYPSIGDIGYFGSIPFYIYGVWLLGKVSGVKISLKSFANTFQAILIPLIMVTVGYILFLQNYEFDWESPLIIFLDFGYPLGQAIYVSLAIVTYFLSTRVLGGIMKKNVLFILVALIVQFLADYVFLFQAMNGTWYAGGFNDYLYLLSYFLMSLALIQLKTVSDDLKATNKKQSTSSTKK